jgi:hypothetical protein
MGRLGENRVGFLGHFALAVSTADGVPLGALGMRTFVRSGEPNKCSQGERHASPDNEERRWWDLVHDVEMGVGRGARSVVHVMDREADSYELLANLIAHEYRFVIRMHYDRAFSAPRHYSPKPKISFALERAQDFMTVEVPVSPRKAVKRLAVARSERDARIAKLAIAATTVTIGRPSWTRIEGPSSLAVNVVYVHEVDVPEGCEPIEWRLATTEPIACAEDVRAVVDMYRRRWVIEEYFRALKQGCAYEKRQLENHAAILNALAVFVPVAWQLLRLRSVARSTPSQKASAVLNQLQLLILRGHPKTQLPQSATTREVMLTIAKLGGHLKNNGEPGWIVLGRGFEKLLAMEEGVLALERCDQS